MLVDTFAISKTCYHKPNELFLIENGWTRVLFDSNGDCFKYTLNVKDEFKPRLTITLRPDGCWTLRAEVSLGSWLYASNLHLVNEIELKRGFDLLSQYVEQKSGIAFDAHTERVTRVDFTRDFQVGEQAIIPIIERFSKITLPKYIRNKINDTSVYFINGGIEKTKSFKIYGKYAEMLKKGADTSELEKARGILRLEISLLNDAVNRTAESLRLPSHHANYMLTQVTADQVIKKAKDLLKFEKIISGNISNIMKFFERSNLKMAKELIYYLSLRKQYGEALWNYPIFNLSKRTCQRRWRMCKEIGVIALE